MKKVFNYLFIAFISTILISSCVDNEFDEPDFPFNDPDITTNATIQSIKALHSEGNFEVITEDLIFKALVVANDSTGNFYKKIIVQDETGGIEILIDGRSLYGKYPVGRRVFVKAKGLTIGDDSNVVQLASLASEGSLVSIPYSELSDIVIGGSLNNPVVPKQMKLNQVSDADISTLVQFVDVEFDSGELGKTYADGIAKSDQNRILKDCNSNEFIIRTSGYAQFANDVLPDKNGELMCIVGKYRNDYQGYVRSTSDVIFQNDRCDGGGTGEISFDKDFEDGNLTSGGWTTQIVVGNASWEAYEFSGDKFGRITNFNGTINEASDSWLISPEVDLANFENPTLNFKNASNYSGFDMEVYVTDNYDGTSKPVLSEWTKLSATLSAGGWEWVESGNISMESFKTKKVYIAFRYQGSDSDGKTWEIDDITMGEGGGVNPGTGIFTDDFESGIGKWNVESVLGDETWTHSPSYGNPDGCAKISGYANNANHANEDWLITPQLDLTSSTNVKLTFDNATKYDGDPMVVYVSTDYSGSGDPTGSTWKELSYIKSGGDWAWVESGVIDLSSYDGQKIYIAYKFTSTDSASATWEIDNVLVK